MPRPKQRRGAEAKKQEKQAKRDKEEEIARANEAALKRERYRKKEMDYANLPTATSAKSQATTGEDGSEDVIDPDALPVPDPDTKAYFKQVADKIRELEELSRQKKVAVTAAEAGEEEEEAEEDDRPLLLKSSLESLSGHEVAIAGDSDTSIILERLLFAMDDFARRVLADRFAGQYEVLSRHRNASHVLQTLFALAAETVDREVSSVNL